MVSFLPGHANAQGDICRSGTCLSGLGRPPDSGGASPDSCTFYGSGATLNLQDLDADGHPLNQCFTLGQTGSTGETRAYAHNRGFQPPDARATP